MTTHMFPRGDDLPLFSGSVYGPSNPPVFVPEVTATQDSLLDLRPVLGSAEPTYQPKLDTQEMNMDTQHTINGITFKCTPQGRVYWSDAWERIHELRKAGILATKFFGSTCYGHTEYYLI